MSYITVLLKFIIFIAYVHYIYRNGWATYEERVKFN